MKANPGKYHRLLSGNDPSKITIGNETISSKCEKLLGIKIDSNLNFLCKKASQKINALSKLASLMNFVQKRLTMNSFVSCHFSNFLVVWMFHCRKLNARINRFHERALRVVYKDFDPSFEELLRRDSSKALHQRNLQKLIIKIFDVKTGIAQEMMKGVFEFADVSYNLTNQSKCSRIISCTERYGIKTTSSIGPKLWDKVHTKIKNSKSPEEFKARIKSWIPKKLSLQDM